MEIEEINGIENIEKKKGTKRKEIESQESNLNKKTKINEVEESSDKISKNEVDGNNIKKVILLIVLLKMQLILIKMIIKIPRKKL